MVKPWLIAVKRSGIKEGLERGQRNCWCTRYDKGDRPKSGVLVPRYLRDYEFVTIKNLMEVELDECIKAV